MKKSCLAPMGDSERSQPIATSEAFYLLAPLKSRYKNTRAESYQIYKKTLDYAEMFCRIQDKSVMSDLRSTLEELGFTGEEIMALGSLLPQSTDEARICVPSIMRLDEEAIEKAIDKISQTV